MVLHNMDGVSVSNLLSSGLALRKTDAFIIQVCAILQPFSYFSYFLYVSVRDWGDALS